MFKSILAVALILSVNSAFAATAPDYVCTSEDTGNTYEVSYTGFTEIQTYGPNGEDLGYQDNISAQVKYFRTHPVTKIVTFTHEEGDVVAKVVEQGNRIVMDYDSDESITCRVGRASNRR